MELGLPLVTRWIKQAKEDKGEASKTLPTNTLKSVFQTYLKEEIPKEKPKRAKTLLNSLAPLRRRHSQQLPSPGLSISKSTRDLRIRTLHTPLSPTFPSTHLIDKMIGDCSEVQQSLMPIWKQACHHATDSLQLLKTSRQALTGSSSPVSKQLRMNARYLETRDQLRNQGKLEETAKITTEPALISPHPKVSLKIIRHMKTLSEQFSPKATEEQELLEEIRDFRRKERDFGDLFKPITAPMGKKDSDGAEVLDSDSLKSLSDLNQFIFKERSRFNTRSFNSTKQRRKLVIETLMSSIEPSPEVYQKAQKIMQREKKQKKLKATRVDNFKPSSFSSMLKTWLLNPISEEQKEMMTEIQAGELDVARKTAIENYRKAKRRKQLQEGKSVLSTLAA